MCSCRSKKQVEERRAKSAVTQQAIASQREDRRIARAQAKKSATAGTTAK